ncbi:MAG: chromate resistance protein [Gammaproteobacteria bacterium]|nr:chromate resistance protein [Gammaproteobacteria bacterium]
MKWVTRERPKIDRIACPWLVSRFIDPDAEFLYVPAGEVMAQADEQSAIPYDIPDVELSHVGELCKHEQNICRVSRAFCSDAVAAKPDTERQLRPTLRQPGKNAIGPQFGLSGLL